MARSGLVFRLVAVLCALAVSWTICFAWLVGHFYEGGESFIVLPIEALLCSVRSVGLAMLLGLVLRIPAIRSRWSWSWAAAVGFTGAIGLMIEGTPGPAVWLLSQEIEAIRFSNLTPAAPSFLALVFAISNWPRPAGLDRFIAWIQRPEPPSVI